MKAIKNIELNEDLYNYTSCLNELQELNEIIQQQDDYIEQQYDYIQQLENNWLVWCGKKLGVFRMKEVI